MASLSEKLASIELNTFIYDNHLGSVSGKVTVVDKDVRCCNFKHTGEYLCELWGCDNINGYPIIITYIEEHDQSDFLDINEESWDWINRHNQICKYSLDLKKCNDQNCCKPLCALKIHELLSNNNSFLPLVVKGFDGHFLNLVHTLEYFNKKLPGYDEHCPSITSDLYNNLVFKNVINIFHQKHF